MQQPDLSLTQVMLLDRIQKGLPISLDEQLERKKHQRVEARCPNPMGSADMAHDAALGRVMQILLKDDTQVYKQFVENECFRRAVADIVLRSQTNNHARSQGYPRVSADGTLDPSWVR